MVEEVRPGVEEDLVVAEVRPEAEEDLVIEDEAVSQKVAEVVRKSSL